MSKSKRLAEANLRYTEDGELYSDDEEYFSSYSACLTGAPWKVQSDCEKFIAFVGGKLVEKPKEDS